MSQTRLPNTGTALSAITVTAGGTTFTISPLVGLVVTGLAALVIGAALVLRFGWRRDREAGTR